MADVSMRDLRNHGGEIVDRVARGEQLTVTRDGTAVARLTPVPRAAIPLEVLRERRANLPDVDPWALRAEVDALIDPSL